MIIIYFWKALYDRFEALKFSLKIMGLSKRKNGVSRIMQNCICSSFKQLSKNSSVWVPVIYRMSFRVDAVGCLTRLLFQKNMWHNNLFLILWTKWGKILRNHKRSQSIGFFYSTWETNLYFSLPKAVCFSRLPVEL